MKIGKLLTLSPFIDKDGLLRVGGRLKHAALTYNQKHPILLPKNHHVTNILILETHIKHWHTGIEATLTMIRNKYWLIDGRSSIR